MIDAGLVTQEAPDREQWLREHLPALHVAHVPDGKWHVISAVFQDALCYSGQQARDLCDEDALENTPIGSLCAHCARLQGDEYAEVL